MTSAQGRTRRFSRGEVDPHAGVHAWFLLTATADRAGELRAYVHGFCDRVGNASVVTAGPAANRSDVSCVYLVVDGGDLACAVQGGPAAAAGLATVRALVDQLYMFSPVLTADPTSSRSA